MFANRLVCILWLANYIFYADSLQCLRCSSNDFNSDCQKGVETDKIQTFTCPEDEDSCYMEYILNEGNVAHYRRGCAPSNWCDIQMGNHESALKFCKTCQGDKCNTDVIRAQDSEIMHCLKCSSLDYDSNCRMGKEGDDVEIVECASYEPSCYMEYLKGGTLPLYRRGCGPADRCQQQVDTHDKDLKYCKSCVGEKCNTDVMGAPNSSRIQCYSCSYTTTIVRPSPCKEGGIEPEFETCDEGVTQCYNAYSMGIGKFPKRTWIRGCAPENQCGIEKDNRGWKLRTCDTCDYDQCNNGVIPQREKQDDDKAAYFLLFR